MLNNDTSRCAAYSNAASESNYTASACQTSTGGTTPPPPASGSTCESKYGSGWHTMDSSGNCFNPYMTEYRTVNGALYSCSTTPATGCTGGFSNPPPPSSQACSSGQYWNGSACVTSTTPPPPYTTCSSGQYWDGTACVTSTYPPPSGGSSSCASNQYWDGTACVTSSTPPPPPAPLPPPPPPPVVPPPPPPPPISFLSRKCPLNQSWNGSYCVVRPQYTAHFMAQVITSVGNLADVISDLFR